MGLSTCWQAGKDTNLIVLRTEANLSVESGGKLLRATRSLGKDHVNPVNPVRFFLLSIITAEYPKRRVGYECEGKRDSGG